MPNAIAASSIRTICRRFFHFQRSQAAIASRIAKADNPAPRPAANERCELPPPIASFAGLVEGSEVCPGELSSVVVIPSESCVTSDDTAFPIGDWEGSALELVEEINGEDDCWVAPIPEGETVGEGCDCCPLDAGLAVIAVTAAGGVFDFVVVLANAVL